MPVKSEAQRFRPRPGASRWPAARRALSRRTSGSVSAGSARRDAAASWPRDCSRPRAGAPRPGAWPCPCSSGRARRRPCSSEALMPGSVSAASAFSTSGSHRLVERAEEFLHRGAPHRWSGDSSLQDGQRRVERAAHAVVDRSRPRRRRAPARPPRRWRRRTAVVVRDDETPLPVDLARRRRPAPAAAPGTRGSPAATSFLQRGDARVAVAEASLATTARIERPGARAAQAANAGTAQWRLPAASLHAIGDAKRQRRSRAAVLAWLAAAPSRSLLGSRARPSCPCRSGDVRAPRLGLDRARRLPHHVELAVGLDLADEHRLVQVVVLRVHRRR